MPIHCASSGCNNTKENSGRIFAHCNSCNTWWCSRHGTKGNRCPGCGHKYLDGASSSGGCFITTATLISIGKDDNCKELQAFRRFRDNWLVLQEDGPSLISEYYKIAPAIVEAIDLRDDREQVYQKLWSYELQPCLLLINSNLNMEALRTYKAAMYNLKLKYLSQYDWNSWEDQS